MARSPRTELVPALLEILEHSDPFVLVLDDVHILRDEQALATLAAVVDGEPAGGVLALVSRTPPTVGLPRRRLRGHVVEVGPGELALTLDEAREIFLRLGVGMDDDRVAAIVARCKGWAGGIHLSALALRDRDDATTTTTAPITGRTRLLADYLVEEVHLATHRSLPKIADELNVSRNTVKTHCVAVYRKLGVTSRSDAVAEARRLGLIEG